MKINTHTTEQNKTKSRKSRKLKNDWQTEKKVADKLKSKEGE